MGTYTYTINTATALQNNLSYTTKRVFKIKACENTLIENNLDELFNNNLCAQDEAYCQPWVPGDKIYLQFRSDNDASISKIISLIDKETGAIITTPFLVTTQTGIDENLTSYYNIILDTTNIEVCCFYIRVTLFFCTPDPALLGACIDSAVGAGASLQQATYDCMVEFCNEENVEEIFTEPYCKVTCEPTILIRGTYTKYDCDLNYYGLFDDDYNPENSFIQQVRVPGEIFKENYSITETVINEDRTATKMQSSYKLLTPKLPPYVVHQMANAFNGQQVFIDGIEYKRAIILEKNNDIGNMWIINTNLLRICSDNDFTCDV